MKLPPIEEYKGPKGIRYVDQLPAELKQLDQWCVALPGNKAPMLPVTMDNPTGKLRNASVVKDEWLSFDDAKYIAGVHDGHIGFVLTKEDPFVCIDFDIKDKTKKDKYGNPYPVEQYTTKEELRRYMRAFKLYDSYAELSRSWNGMHIWIKGQLTGGCRRDGIEIYPHDRFIICTGSHFSEGQYLGCEDGEIYFDIYDDTPKKIENRQELLNHMVREIGAIPIEPDFQLEELPATHADNDLFQLGATAENREKFVDLCNGNWKKYNYPSQSEADFALLSMLAFYSPSNEQVRRMFRLTVLGQRQKSQQDNRYIDRSLVYIRKGQAERAEIEINLEKQSKELAALAQHKAPTDPHYNSANYEEPTEATLQFPPGRLGQVAEYIYSISPRPVPEVSISAAIGLAAGICGKTFTVNGSGLNMYTILVGRSGIGKEAMHTGIGHIIHRLRNGLPAIDKFVTFENFVSGPALMKACAETSSFVNVCGEWGRLLKRMTDEQRIDPATHQLRTVMTNLYQKSGKGSTVGGLTYSNKENNVKIPENVAYSMLGETTPDTFYDAITQSAMDDGFLSRFLVIDCKSKRPPLNIVEQDKISLPQDILQYFSYLVAYAVKMIDTHQSLAVRFDKLSTDLARAFDEECDQKINATEDESIRQLWNRAHLKALRLACLLAVMDNYINPVVTIQHFEWALEVVRRNVAAISEKLLDGDIGSGDEQRSLKLLHYMKLYLSGKNKNVDSHLGTMRTEQLRADGIVTRNFLRVRVNRARAFYKHKNGVTFAFEQTMKDLEERGLIKKIDAGSAHKKYGFSTGICYQILHLDAD